MAGARIEVEFDDAAALAALARLRAALRDKRPVLGAIGAGLASNTRERFREQRGPDGAPWKALSPAYAAIKAGSHILVGSGMSGGLQGSITFAAGADTVSVGTGKVYGAVHQFGATIRPKTKPRLVFPIAGGLAFAKQVTIPARPYLGFDERDRITAVEAIEDALDAAIRGTGRP